MTLRNFVFKTFLLLSFSPVYNKQNIFNKRANIKFLYFEQPQKTRTDGEKKVRIQARPSDGLI